MSGNSITEEPNAAAGSLDDALLARAARLGTATIHESAGRIGDLPHAIKPIHPAMSLAGRALPVRSPAGDNLWLHRALAEMQADDVLVVDTGSGDNYGYWGEVMATAAMARGAAGLVLNGGVRDSLQLIELGLPTFSAAIAIKGTIKGQSGDGAIGDPVRFDDVVVRRGDLVVGDADGVVVIPAHRAQAVIAASEARDAAEVDILARLRAGELTLDIYSLRGTHSG
jgi:4-hydroxy-4-methyl-2-oxoglutarate aldolase